MMLSLYDVFGNRLLVAAGAADDDELRSGARLLPHDSGGDRPATDGLALFAPRDGFVRTAFYNPDRSFERLCGNSLFVAARLFARAGESILVRPFDGPEVQLSHSEHGFLEASGVLRIEPRPVCAGAIGTIWVHDTGSPHAVVATSIDAAAFVHEHDVNLTTIEGTGRKIRARTFERGVFAETAACGTGALAAAIASGRRDQWLEVLYPGGRYAVLIREPEVHAFTWTLRVPVTAVRVCAAGETLTSKPDPESLPARAPSAARRSRTQSA